MSSEVNQDLVERAVNVMAYFEGTDLETAIANNLDRNDLDMVSFLVKEGELEMERQDHENQG